MSTFIPKSSLPEAGAGQPCKTGCLPLTYITTDHPETWINVGEFYPINVGEFHLIDVGESYPRNAGEFYLIRHWQFPSRNFDLKERHFSYWRVQFGASPFP